MRTSALLILTVAGATALTAYAGDLARFEGESRGALTHAESADRRASRVAENMFESWRPVDDETLLLFAADEMQGCRVSFESPCKGLLRATELMFVSSGAGRDAELYDSIMLQDSTRCRFARVVPTLFD